MLSRDSIRTGETVSASLFAPGVTAAAAHNKLAKLGCCLARQNNAISLALTGLLADIDSVRHATLQN